jgi:multisubunit Na+/H+ antiporter MnhC subunit
MDRRLARKNLVTALIVTAVVIVMFGLTFMAAAAYVS